MTAFLKSWNRFHRGSLLYAAIPVAIVLLIMQSTKKRRVYIGLVSLILLLLIYNPVSYSILTKIVGGTGYRVFWLLPAWSAFAYVLYTAINHIPWKKAKLPLTVLISGLLLLYGLHTNTYTYTLSNIYQIPGDTVELADEMLQIMDERGMESAVLYGNADFLSTLRQYSARFILHLEPRDHPLMEENAGRKNYLGLGQFITTGTYRLEPDYASDILIDNEVYFIVIYRTLTDSIEYLGNLGWHEIAGNDTFVVLSQDSAPSSISDE